MKIPKPRKLNSGRWNVQVTTASGRVSVTADTRAECQERAMILMIGDGRRDYAPKDLTVRMAVEAFINARTNVLSPSTIRSYRAMARTRFAGYMDKPLGDVAWQQVVNREAALVSAKTVRNAWSLIESSYRFAGITPPEVTLPQVPRSDRPWLTPEQVRIFVAAIKGRPGELPALIALHGLRRSEIFALSYNHVDCSMIHVRGAMVLDEHSRKTLKATNKNQTSARDVPIVIPRLSEIIEAERPKHAGTDLICTAGIETPRRQVNEICEELGLPLVGMHGLRHSFASLAYEVGMSERETMLIGGWSDVNTLHRIYTHISERKAEERAAQIRNFFIE